MSWGLRTAAAIAALIAAAGTSSACQLGCTDDGCNDEAVVNVQLTTASFVPGHYSLTVTTDATTTTTNFDIDVAGDTVGVPFLSAGCGAPPGACLGIAGASTFSITLQGTPAFVEVEETRDGVRQFYVSAPLQYGENQPNLGCGPICAFASADFDLTRQP